MADVIIRGEIENRNEAEFRAVVSCSSTGPSGSIRGEFDAEFNGKEFEYAFRSIRPTRIRATRSGSTRFVRVVFRNARVTNLTNNVTTFGATIILRTSRNRTGSRRATLTIFRPGRVTLRASGFLEDGAILVFREVFCRR